MKTQFVFLFLIATSVLVPNASRAQIVDLGFFGPGHAASGLNRVAERAYLYKAKALHAWAGLVEKLPTDETGMDMSSRVPDEGVRAHLFLALSVSDVIHGIRNDWMKEKFLSIYEDSLAWYGHTYHKTSLGDLPSERYTRFLALKGIQISFEACQDYFNGEQDRPQREIIVANLLESFVKNNPLKGTGSVEWIQKLVASFESSEGKRILANLTENPRTESFGSTIQTLLEWLKVKVH